MPAYIPNPQSQTPSPKTSRGTPRKSAADIRCTYRRHSLRLQEAALIDSCRRLCALWHNEFGACLTLDTQRLRALLNRLNDFAVEQLGWAILAYREECDGYQGKYAGMHKSLVTWLYDDRLEEYITRGKALEEKRRRTKPRAESVLANERRALNVAALYKAFESLSADDRRVIVDQAIRELELRAPLLGCRTEANPLIRSKIYQLMQRREFERPAATIGQAVTEALS